MFNKMVDSVIRYCKPTQVDNEEILVGAFYLRKKDLELDRPEDEKELSVDHFEYFHTDNYNEIKNQLISRGINPKKNGYLVKIKYSEVFNGILDNLFFMIDIKNDHDSHCLIKNLYQHDEEAAFIFLKCIIDKKKINSLI